MGCDERAASARGDRGSVAIEFALLLPILVLLVFGIIEFGRGYNTKNTVTHSSREAARVLALGTGDPAAAARAAAPALDPGLLQVTATASPCTPGQPVSVTVSYPLSYTIPLFGSGTWSISSTGTMRCGG
jgi:Flp pilus assembly protein TadG